jgi:hypothetical protein
MSGFACLSGFDVRPQDRLDRRGCQVTNQATLKLRPARLPDPKTIPHRQFADYVRIATCCRVTDLGQLRKELEAAGPKRIPQVQP